MWNVSLVTVINDIAPEGSQVKSASTDGPGLLWIVDVPWTYPSQTKTESVQPLMPSPTPRDKWKSQLLAVPTARHGQWSWMHACPCSL